MNLAQARRLALLAEQAQPMLPQHFDPDQDQTPEAGVYVHHDGRDDLTVRFLSLNDMLAVFPECLYIDVEGQLYWWDDDKIEAEAKTPCNVAWTMGNAADPRQQYRRYFRPVPLEAGASADTGRLRWIISDDQGDEKPELEVITEATEHAEGFMSDLISAANDFAATGIYSYTLGPA